MHADVRAPHRLYDPRYSDALAQLTQFNFDAFDKDERSCGPQETRLIAAELSEIAIPGHIGRPVDLASGRQVLFGHNGLVHWGEAYPGIARLADITVDDLCICLPPYTHYGHMLTDILAPAAEAHRLGVFRAGEAVTMVMPGQVRPFVRAFVKGLEAQGVKITVISPTPMQRVIARRYLYVRTHCPNRERIFGACDVGAHLTGLFRSAYGAGMSGIGKRVYLKRTGAKARKVEGEDKLIEQLTARGFRVLEADWANHPEQVAAFAEADVIVGVHGAGLANVIFCRPGTRVVEILAGDWRKTTVLHWAAENNLEYMPIIGSAEGELQAFSIDAIATQDQIMSWIEP